MEAPFGFAFAMIVYFVLFPALVYGGAEALLRDHEER